MEAQILEIIISHEYWTNGADQSAAEIALMVREFVEWQIFDNDNNFFPQMENEQKVYWDYDKNKCITYDELFDYWFNNIRK
jgi:hypothetical protein